MVLSSKTLKAFGNLVDFILYINFVQISCYNIFVEKLISSNIGKLEVRWIGSFDDSSPGPVITN